MKAKSDRFRSTLGEHTPQPFDFHTHEVRWREHGFTIVRRCYCERAAQGMARFQQRMGNDASVVARKVMA